MTSLWVVIPTYNEVDNLVPLLERSRAALASCEPPLDVTFLVVDDGSPDGTGELADALAARWADVRVLHRREKSGLAAAYLAGFDVALIAGADLVVEMDADLSHDPADLPRLVAAARDGADIALGSRYVPGGSTEGWPLPRRLLSRAGGAYASFVLGLGVRDPTGGFKCFRAGTLRALDLEAIASRGHAFQVETTFLALRSGRRVVEVPITFREREHGHSKMSLAIAVEAIWRVPLLRFGRATDPEPAASMGSGPGPDSLSTT
jgi:dolichol-phosphate mannosyltransferase